MAEFAYCMFVIRGTKTMAGNLLKHIHLDSVSIFPPFQIGQSAPSFLIWSMSLSNLPWNWFALFSSMSFPSVSAR